MLAVVVSGDGIPALLREADSSRRDASSTPNRQRGPSPSPPSAPTGYDAKPARCPSSKAIDRAGARLLIESVTEERWLDPAETRTLLSAYGIPLVPERTVGSAEEAVAAARELGFPAVVKTAVAGVHKTDSGGVALGLATADDVRAAALRIGPPLIVQPMIAGGVEFLAGVVQDPVFGPLVAFGPGGVLAELIGDARFAVAPLTDVEADELIHGGKAGRLVAGFRGGPPADAAALADLVHRLARLGEENPEVAELDLNPVLGLADNCVAVDARVRLQSAPTTGAVKSW